MSCSVANVYESSRTAGNMHAHFSRIASQYNLLRSTDLEPVVFMTQRMDGLPFIKAADIGCGGGRYDRIICRVFGERIDLTCVDTNAEMLDMLNGSLTEDGFENYTSIQSSAEDLPLPDNSYDCIFTFNAIHHFDLPKFIQQCSRILRNDGYLFIYTRLQAQNRKNIWGRHFPMFSEKEERLPTLDLVTQTVDSIMNMWLQSIEYYKYKRVSSISELEKKIRCHHYSTFSLYAVAELERGIDEFKKNIGRTYPDTNRIHWYDENILFVVRKAADTGDLVSLAFGPTPAS
jgi:ubiquinone/menaquinone biosynthesis C-methylase UbiE